jgi:hypothetical protein
MRFRQLSIPGIVINRVFKTSFVYMKNSQPHLSNEPLLVYFGKFFPLKDEEKELVRAKFHSRLYRRRQFVLQEGDVCTQFNFVVRGC